MDKIKVGIVGGTGYTGVELLRRVFDSIPAAVKEGRADLGDGEQNGKGTGGDSKPRTVDFSKA